ncbi:hypothetical protein KIW84_070717, partial [Lathyrus oleraceus]
IILFSKQKMTRNGELKISLITARGFHNNDFIKDVNPYVIVKYTWAQTKVSRVSYAPTVYGTDPWWNDIFYFDTTNNCINVLQMKLYENATHKLIGIADVPETDYQIFNDHGVYVGDIYVALAFTPHQED